MKKKHHKLIPVFIILGIGLALLVGWLVQLLWNATVTAIFETRPITYWQGVMLLILAKIFFSSHYNVHKDHHKKIREIKYPPEPVEVEAEK